MFNDNLLWQVVANMLDVHSIGALATALGPRVKDVYKIRCRGCGVVWINRLGKKMRLRHPNLRCNTYRCRPCHRQLIAKLSLQLLCVREFYRFHIDPYHRALLDTAPSDEDDGEAHVAPLDVDGLITRTHQPEVERAEG